MLATHVGVAENTVLCSGTSGELGELGEEIPLFLGEVIPDEFFDRWVDASSGEDRDSLPGQHVGEAPLEDLLFDVVEGRGGIAGVDLLDIYLYVATFLHDMYTR